MTAPALPPPADRVLAFDTSTERMAVALHAPGGPWQALVEGGAAASAGLLPQIRRLLALANLPMSQLQFIAFGQGPGAFTGLRTACAVAQGLGFGLGCPLLAVDSLQIVAEDARGQAQPETGDGWHVGVAMDARMDEVYAARYRWQDGAWTVLQAPLLCTPLALQAAWAQAGLHAVAGSAWSVFGERLPPPPGTRLFLHEADRAAAMLRLALLAAAAGAGVAAELALPLYLRDKVAFTTAERQATRDAALAAAAA